LYWVASAVIVELHAPAINPAGVVLPGRATDAGAPSGKPRAKRPTPVVTLRFIATPGGWETHPLHCAHIMSARDAKRSPSHVPANKTTGFPLSMTRLEPGTVPSTGCGRLLNLKPQRRERCTTGAGPELAWRGPLISRLAKKRWVGRTTPSRGHRGDGPSAHRLGCSPAAVT
jgi:hypothetical protein